MKKHDLSHEELRVLRFIAGGETPAYAEKIMGQSIAPILQAIHTKLGFAPTRERCQEWMDIQLGKIKRSPRAMGKPTPAQEACLRLYAQGYDYAHIARTLNYSTPQSPMNSVSHGCQKLGIKHRRHHERRAAVRAWFNQKEPVTMSDPAF